MVEDKDDNEVNLEEKIESLRQKSLGHFWGGMVFLLLLLIAFAMGVTVLASAHATTATITIKNPEQRAELLAKKIANVKTKAEGQYAKYLNKMDDDTILAVDETFEVLYHLSMESEEQYTELLATYQAMVYGAASRIKGSGEWFYYYEQNIIRLVNAAKNREQKLKQHISED